MNYSMIFFIIGWVFIIEAALMAPSAWWQCCIRVNLDLIDEYLEAFRDEEF